MGKIFESIVGSIYKRLQRFKNNESLKNPRIINRSSFKNTKSSFIYLSHLQCPTYENEDNGGSIIGK